MAKVLTTKASTAELEEILLKAKKEVYLISYHYIISEDFIRTINRVTKKGVIIHLVYGNYIKPLAEIKDNPNIRIYNLPKLHAKIFANESKCIVGSMNFSEPSEKSMELGILISKELNNEAFAEVLDHCQFIVSEAKAEFKITSKPIDKRLESAKEWVKANNEFVDPSPNAANWKNSNYNNASGKFIPLGYCIRTGERIPLDHTKPLSYDAYNVWANYGDYQYPENYDHFTGEHTNGNTSMGAPILQKNWNKYLRAIES